MNDYFSIVFDMQKLSDDEKKAIFSQAQQAFIDGKAISAGWGIYETNELENENE